MNKAIKKCICHIIPFFSLMLTEILYFVFGANSKNILTIQIFYLTPGFFQLFITRLFLLAVNFFVIYIIANYRYFYNTFVWKSVLWKRIALTVVIRFVFDICSFFPVTLKYADILQVFVDTLFIFFMFYICYKDISVDSMRFKWRKNSKILFGLIILSFLLYSVYYILDFQKTMKFIEYITQKYISGLSIDYYNNIEFKDSVSVLIYKCIISVLIYLFFRISYICETEKTTTKNVKSHIIALRCILIIFFALVLSVFKAILFPYGLMNYLHVSKNDRHIYNDEKYFYSLYNEFELFRLTLFREHECVYTSYKVKIRYGNDDIVKFKRNIIDTENKLTKIDDNLEIYNTQAFMYVENEKPIVIMSSDINSQKENSKITESVMKLIELGYFDFLEYSYEYMLRYEPEYLEKNLNLFLEGKYNHEVNDNINDEYIKSFCTEAIQKDFKTS